MRPLQKRWALRRILLAQVRRLAEQRLGGDRRDRLTDRQRDARQARRGQLQLLAL